MSVLGSCIQKRGPGLERAQEAGLSGEMALRIEKAFGIDMDTLMRMQSSYDIARTRGRADMVDVERYAPSPR